ncbi:FAD:protein FMN transferase [Reinekea sp. G2M2-21]|uniref:FAD:protein FMN transferase n=1 Tax=Reinekea sp. G2M2-21 TaxID=2788942 RepID=UPI0018AAA701|nr:FAD:protein FMN transferase [Reinekea sp. G2M2-21]
MSARLRSFGFKAMGGPCNVHLWLREEDELTKIEKELTDEVRRLEAKFSRFQPSSLLSQINRGELNEVSLDAETVGLFNYVDQCFDLSGHMFDPTIGSLHRVWDFKIPNLPDPRDLERALQHIGWKKVNWDGRTVNLTHNVQIDLGGIVKEFAVDRLCTLLKEKGLIGLVNLSGDIAVSQAPEDKPAWKVAIQHPRKAGAIAEVDLAAGAIAGSGDYERFIEIDGVRYCHLLRPDTGYPAPNGFCAVSVIAENCLLAGTVSTVAMLKGELGHAWLEEMQLPYVAFDQALQAYSSIEV